MWPGPSGPRARPGQSLGPRPGPDLTMVRRRPRRAAQDNPSLEVTAAKNFKCLGIFGNVKAFNLKKIKIIAEPVAAMARGGPAAGGRWQANS